MRQAASHSDIVLNVRDACQLAHKDVKGEPLPMSVPDTVSSLTQDEVADAIRSLPPAGWARLLRVAQTYSCNRPIDPKDLLQEAFLRALGSRHCPRDVEIIRFLTEAMRSIAWDVVKEVRRRPPPLPLHDKSGALVIDPPDRRPTAEWQLASEQEAGRFKQAVISIFEDDVVAQVTVEGIMEGMEGAELQELTGLDVKGLATKRRMIRRRIDNTFPEGWKS